MDGCVDGKLMSKFGSVSLLPFDLRMAEEGRAERTEEEKKKQSRVGDLVWWKGPGWVMGGLSSS